MIPALLALADGSVFRGQSLGVPGQTVGEVVFNTAMTGYQEILTDPSYARQIVTLTAPQIGNTGVNPEDVESSQIHAAGLIIRQASRVTSNWRSTMSLGDYLKEAGKVAISGVDTRRLTRHLRTYGAQAGCVVAASEMEATIDVDAAVAAARAFPGLAGMDLAKEVSRTSVEPWTEGVWRLGEGYAEGGEQRFHVVAYDFGVKRNILRLLVDRGCKVTIVPAQTPASEVLALKPDGVFLSNGPGDPEPCGYAIDAIRALLEQRLPIFGICLGHQLLGLASGARTVKMPFGHHGANHPVQDIDSRQVLITSQNHGFAVEEDSLPNVLRATHRSLFDGSLQGIARTDTPAFGFQGHPEASPGPQDCQYLFDHFIDLMQGAQASAAS